MQKGTLTNIILVEESNNITQKQAPTAAKKSKDISLSKGAVEGLERMTSDQLKVVDKFIRYLENEDHLTLISHLVETSNAALRSLETERTVHIQTVLGLAEQLTGR